MRTLLSSLLLCVLTSLITLLSYIGLQQRFKTQEDQINYSYAVKNDHINLGGNLRQHFYSAQPNDFINAAKKSIPSVVSITTYSNSKKTRNNQSPISSGSGVLISSNGHIVTNYHVIEESESIVILDNEGAQYEGKIIGSDKSTDIAVIKIEKTNTPHLIFGNSDSIQVGEWVLAVGNPFKLKSTVTAGIVSAKGRNINFLSRQGIESFIQTDAAINPGNSGGALVNSHQELIGINTAILSSSGKYEGFSFAIPSNIVQKVVKDILSYGTVQRGWLGVNIFNIDSETMQQLNLKNGKGVLVDLVERNSAAADAGLQREDIIKTINSIKINSISTFTEQLALRRPGDNVTIGYLRNGKLQTAQVTLRNQLNTTDFIAVRKDKEFIDLGIEVRDLDSGEKIRLGKNGVYVVSVARGTKIHGTNMEPGYIIEQFNGNPVNNVDDLLRYINDSSGNVFLEGFYEKYPGQFPYAFVL